jgi:hypothetical protein
VKVNISYLVIALVAGLSPSILLGQNVSWEDCSGGSSYGVTADGTQNAFASMSVPSDMVFDSTGALFKMDFGSICEFKPDAAQNIFDSGLVLSAPVFDSTACLIKANSGSTIPEFIPDETPCAFLSWLVPPDTTFNRYKFMPDGTFSSLVHGTGLPYSLPFNQFPEPAMACLPGLGLLSLIHLKRCKKD